MNRFWDDIDGSMLVEYTIVFPLMIFIILGSVDASYLFVERSWANKAAYMGARLAIVSPPMAPSLADPDVVFTQAQLGSQLGNLCLALSSGAENGNCPSMSTTVSCTSSGCHDCTSSSCSSSASAYGFSITNFNAIVSRMQAIFPRLAAANVKIEYQFNGAGFVGRPGGLPMNVTVSITGVQHQFFFLPGIDAFFGGNIRSLWDLPAAATTLTTECLVPSVDDCTL